MIDKMKSRLSANELDTLKGLLGVSDSRVSKKQKTALNRLIMAYTALSNAEMVNSVDPETGDLHE